MVTEIQATRSGVVRRSTVAVTVASSDTLRWRLSALRRLPDMTSLTSALSAPDRPRDWGRCAVSNSFAHVKLQSRFLPRRRRRQRVSAAAKLNGLGGLRRRSL